MPGTSDRFTRWLSDAVAKAATTSSMPAAQAGGVAAPNLRALQEATRLTRAGRLTEAVETLQGAGGPASSFPWAMPTGGPLSDGGPLSTGGPLSSGGFLSTAAGRPGAAGAVADARGTRGSFTGPAGTRSYRLVVPSSARSARPGLLVMLHGGTQSADDFAAATGMDELAEREGFVVVYPEQSRQANAMGYWNWFEPRHQVREGGEPSLIAGIVRAVAAETGTDPDRTFVAGFSAGAAMAAVMGATHPDLVAGIGVHSGLPHGAARDVGSAFAAMRGGPSPVVANPCPTIVVHGDADRTVAASCAAGVVAAALQDGPRCTRQETAAPAADGRGWTQERWTGPDGRLRVESWTVHGSGHAWSGGRAGGSYTDPAGPDASRAMVEFFGLAD
jgi:poly(hydroxyalkanoate) depolymerase family esterase